MPRKKPQSVADIYDKIVEDQERLPTPQLADIAAAFIHEMGGPGAIAKHLVLEFNAGKVGSLQRARLLDRILQGLKKDDSLPPVTQLDDRRLKELLNRTLKEYVDGESAEPAAELPAGRPPEAEAEGAASQENAVPEEVARAAEADHPAI